MNNLQKQNINSRFLRVRGPNVSFWTPGGPTETQKAPKLKTKIAPFGIPFGAHVGNFLVHFFGVFSRPSFGGPLALCGFKRLPKGCQNGAQREPKVTQSGICGHRVLYCNYYAGAALGGSQGTSGSEHFANFSQPSPRRGPGEHFSGFYLILGSLWGALWAPFGFPKLTLVEIDFWDDFWSKKWSVFGGEAAAEGGALETLRKIEVLKVIERDPLGWLILITPCSPCGGRRRGYRLCRRPLQHWMN